MLIDDGVGATVRERVSALNCSSTECSHTHYPAESSRAEFGVTVEAAGCVTRQTVCIEAPVCKGALKCMGVHTKQISCKYLQIAQWGTCLPLW